MQQVAVTFGTIADGRVVEHNAPLCDGTPRRETGFRPVVLVRRVDGGKRYVRGPLFGTEGEAIAWVPANG